jgi:hypothetical protein
MFSRLIIWLLDRYVVGDYEAKHSEYETIHDRLESDHTN